MDARENRDALIRQLTAAMAAGDEGAFRRFYESCFDQIYRHLLVRTRGQEHLAQELAQTVVIRVARYIKPFHGERFLWAWLYQLCRSAHVDWLRKNGRPAPEFTINLLSAAPEQESNSEEELLQHLENSMDDLPASERELLRLAYFEEVPQRLIAERLQSTPKAIESKLGRIRQKLRLLLLEKLKEYALF